MAKCPRCKKEWQWGWCTNTYRQKETGEFCEEVFLFSEDKESDSPTEVEMFRCDCGQILGFSINDGNGMYLCNHPNWEGTDWEDEEHKYPSDED